MVKEAWGVNIFGIRTGDVHFIDGLIGRGGKYKTVAAFLEEELKGSGLEYDDDGEYGHDYIGFHPQYQFRKEDDAPHFQNEKEATEYIVRKLEPYTKEDKNMLSWLVDYYSEPGKN